MTKNARIAAAVAFLFHSTSALALDPDTPNLTFNGFGTVGVVHSDEHEADFVADIFAPDGAGHTRDWSPEVDSRLGLQLTAGLTPRLSAIGQVIIEQRYDDTYKPTVEWANVKFDVTQNLTARAGRLVQPTLMISEYRKVGYAAHWVRPPQEVYRILPVTNIDGIDFSYRSRFGGFTNTLRSTLGQKDSKFAGLDEIESRDTLIITDTLEWGATTLFAAYSTLRLTIDELNAVFDGFRQFGPEGEAIADRYDVDDKRFEFINVGARHDPGDWFVMGEWIRSESRTFVGDSRGWYISGGYRFGSVTPYLTLAGVRVASNTSDPGLSAPGAEDLNAFLNSLLGSAAEQKSIAMGARWDFAPGADLKVQLDYIDLENGSSGVLINEQPDFRRGGKVVLFSTTLDFVF